MNIDFYKKYLKEARILRNELYTTISRGNTKVDHDKATFVAIYLLYLAHKHNCLDLTINQTFDKLYEILNDYYVHSQNAYAYTDAYSFISKVKVLTSECLNENSWPYLKTLSKKYSINVIRTAALLFDDNKFNQERLIAPASINRLVSRILDVDDKEDLLNIFSGIGNYLVYENAVNEKVNFVGVEPDEKACLLASMKSTVLDKAIKLYDYSPFQLLESEKDHRYSKIFTTCPFNYHYDYLFERFYLIKNQYFLNIMAEIPIKDPKTINAEWVFNVLTLHLLKQNGRAISLMPCELLADDNNYLMRKYFIDQQAIHAIIALPDNLFKTPNVKTALVLFSKQKSTNVKFVDATNVYTISDNQQADLSEENIDKIALLLEDQLETSKVVDIATLKQHNFDLNPLTYL